LGRVAGGNTGNTQHENSNTGNVAQEKEQEEVANESWSLCTKDYILAKIGQEWCNRKISYYLMNRNKFDDRLSA